MKNLKIGLRIWIGLTSIVSFLGGWVILSHSEKPVSLFPDIDASPAAASLPSPLVQNQTHLPTLQPIPSLEDLAVTGARQLPSISAAPSVANNNSFSAPRLRTRGS